MLLTILFSIGFVQVSLQITVPFLVVKLVVFAACPFVVEQTVTVLNSKFL